MQRIVAQPSDVMPTIDPATIEEVQRFVDGLRTRARTIHICKTCGSAMQFADATFALWNGDRSWTIPLPICPKCDSEMLKLNSAKAA